MPESTPDAQATLRRQCAGSHRQAGLVRVVDKYGDYGFVGFYLMRNRRTDPAPGLANQTLIHYCFSCRTLGMFVEQWFYDHLRRPALTVVGEVLTDLNEERTIDWIRLVPSVSMQMEGASKVATEIRVIGGCEANSVAHYLGAHCDSVSVTGNFQAGALFVRLNSCHLLLSAVNHAGPRLERELERLGIPLRMTGSDYFRNPPTGTLFVFGGGRDAFGVANRLRHSRHGWQIHVTTGESENFVFNSEEEVARIIKSANSDAGRRQLEFAIRHIRKNYELVDEDAESELDAAMEELVRRVPIGCKLIIVLDDERQRSNDGAIRLKRQRVHYNEWARDFAARFAFVGTAAFSDAIESEDEILTGGNHYARTVYWRLAEKIVKIAGQLESRPRLPERQLKQRWRPVATREREESGAAAKNKTLDESGIRSD